MNKTLLVLLAAAFLLLTLPERDTSRGRKRKKTPLPVRKLAGYLRKKFDSKKKAIFVSSTLLGYKRGLSKSIKKKFQLLNLLHLFTPSGLHFTSLLFFITPFLSLLTIKQFKLKPLFISGICFSVFWLPGFYSLKRIAILKLLHLSIGSRFSFFMLFIMTFLIDFLRGSYQLSPLSFTYSFLFLGLIMSQEKFSIKLPLSLLSGQMLIALYLKTDLNIVGAFLGMGITSLFTFYFPLLLLTLFFIPLFGSGLSEWLTQFFLSLVNTAYSSATILPSFQPTLFHLFILGFLLSGLNYHKKRAISVALLLFYSFNSY